MAESTNKEVNYIREKLRDEISLSRKQQRDATINRNRKALGAFNGSDELTEDFVKTTAKSLKKNTLTETEYDKLQNALIKSENHINAFFKVDHATHGLMRDLSSTASQSKLSAANCCCNLALGNSKACNTLCKIAAPYLVAQLDSTNQLLVETCVWTIGNLVSGGDKSIFFLQIQNCMKSLINLTSECSDKLLPAVSYACVRYIHKGADVIDRLEINNLAVTVAQRYPAVSDVDTMWLLATLSSISDCSDNMIICTFRICDYLQEAVINENDSTEKMSAALRIICNMVSEISGQVANYLLKNNIEKCRIFFDKLLSHQYIHIREETLWLLGNLSKHHLDSVQQSVIPILTSLQSLKLAVNSCSNNV